MANARDGWTTYEWPLAPIWSVAVGLPRTVVEARRQAGPPAPKGIVVACLLDTGASHSFATMDVFERLDARPTGERVIAGGSAECEGRFENFRVDLIVPATTGGPALELRDFPLSSGTLSWPPG